MFIVFNGKGWVAPVPAIAAAVVSIALFDGSKLALWIMLMVSGVVDHQLGKRWNSEPPRLLKDLRTGEVLEEYPDHSFFWVPLQYWLWIKVFFAASALVAFLSTRYDI